MRWIYVDNFRGFSDSLIPIKDVNFLVGENSTGKSSILALINLMSNPQFWMSHEFNTQDFRFGGFQDIVSAESSNRSEFRIGLLNSYNREKTGKTYYKFAFLTFRKKDGQPVVYKSTHLYRSSIVKLRFTTSNVYYNIENLEEPPSLERAQNLFKEVQRNGKDDRQGFLKWPLKLSQFQLYAPFLAATIVNAKSKEIDISTLINDIPHFPFNLTWLAPIRTKPRRTYDGFRTAFTPEGDHTPHIIRKVLKSKTKAKAFTGALSRFGSASGLFKRVKVREFSKVPSAPFELQVILSKKPLNLKNVGYGVSQILPVTVEMLTRPRGAWFAIQQSEIHLHPRAQSAFGDLLFQVANLEQKRFLIETHSDFTIDRFRLNYRKKGKKAESQVLFFERSQNGNTVHTIPIDSKGNYDEKQPPGFRRFFIREQMKLLGI